MFVCEGFVTDPAIGTAPTIFDAFIFEIPEPFEAIKRPWTFNPVRVPSDVMFGCALSETDRAKFARATFPMIFDPTIPEIPEPFPYIFVANRLFV